jgi:transketolase
VAGFLAENLPAPVRRVGVMDVFGQSGMAGELLDLYGLRAPNVVEQALRILEGGAS